MIKVIKKMNLRIFFGFFLISAILTGCASKEDPIINPNPQYFLTFHGVIAPQLQKEVQLRFIQTYVGKNPQCAKVTNILAGIKENPAKNIVFMAHPDKSTGQYKVKIPLDYYTSGYCQWIPWGLGYTLTDEDFKLQSDGFALLNYNDRETQKYNPPVFNFTCIPGNMTGDGGLDNCQINVPNNTDALIYVRTYQSFDQELNVIVGVNS